MLWINLDDSGKVHRYACSNCGVLLLTVEGFALPSECRACGATEGGAGDA